MVLDAPALADASARGSMLTGRRIRSAVAGLAIGLLFADPVNAEDLREAMAGYLRAMEARSVGHIEARAYGESKRPAGPPIPYAGMSAIAAPYDEGLERQLDAIKGRQRDSIATYTSTHGDLTGLLSSYERKLSEAGAGGLLRRATADADGALRWPAVPAGEWLLVGWREESHPTKSVRAPGKGASKFAQSPVATGYAAVSYWRVRVTVRSGETSEITLSDRSVWLTAVREEFGTTGGPPTPGGPLTPHAPSR